VSELTEQQMARMVQRALGDETYSYPSSSSDKTYTVLIGPDGKISCDCRGWITKKAGHVRTCKHVIDRMAKQQVEGRKFEPHTVGSDAYWYRIAE
jgi:hypothetical protein